MIADRTLQVRSASGSAIPIRRVRRRPLQALTGRGSRCGPRPGGLPGRHSTLPPSPAGPSRAASVPAGSAAARHAGGAAARSGKLISKKRGPLEAAHASPAGHGFHRRRRRGERSTVSTTAADPAVSRSLTGLETHVQPSTHSSIFSGASHREFRRCAQQVPSRLRRTSGCRARCRCPTAAAKAPSPGLAVAAGCRRRSRSLSARTTSVPICPRATRSAASTEIWCGAGGVDGHPRRRPGQGA